MEYQNENFNGECDLRSRRHEGWLMPENLHEYSEFLYCRRGEGSVTVNGRTFPIREKQLVWLPPNYVHRYDCEGAEVICAVFSNDLIPLFFKKLSGRYFCVFPVAVGELEKIILEFPTLSKEDYLRVSGYLNLICAKVMAEAEFDSAPLTDGILYQKVISYIAEHYTEPITLKSISKKFGYNEKYLSHALHELTGIHFCRLLTSYRINRAKSLLAEGREHSITEIALSCGFSAVNTFHRAFKEAMDITPLEYRRRYGQ